MGRAIILVLIVGALGGLSFVLFVIVKYLRIIINIFLDVPITSVPRVAEDTSAEKVQFKSFDGIALTGIFFRGGEEKSPAPTIIFSHELGSDKNSCNEYAHFLKDAGYNLFAFDYRGFGESSNSHGYVPRQWVSSKEVDDLLGAIGYVASRSDVDSDRIGLFGISRGGSASICAAARSDLVKAVVCDSSFCTRQTLEDYIRKWASIFARVKLFYENMPDGVVHFLSFMTVKLSEIKLKCQFPSLDRMLRKIPPRPILIIHGQNDNYINISQAKVLFDAALDPKELWCVQGARHNESIKVEPEEYRRKVTELFDRVIRS